VSERPVGAPEGTAAARSFAGPRTVGVLLLLVGIVVLLGTFQIGGATGFRPIGPRFVPTVVGIGLMLLAIAFLVRTTARPDLWLAERAAEEERATSWPTVGGVALALVAYAVGLAPLGYIIATALFIPIVARLLGSANLARDAVVGLAIGLAVWFGFTEFLGVRLPAGLLDPLL